VVAPDSDIAIRRVARGRPSSGSRPAETRSPSQDWARRAWLEGTGVAPDGALDGLAVSMSSRQRTPSAFARALMTKNVGSVALGRRDRARARTLLDVPRHAKAVTGPARSS